jgi:hypothetical protein
MSGPFWTPESILEEINVGVKWADVVKDAEAVMRTRAITTTGTSIWSPIHAHMPSLSGIIDPALEWMYEQNMVKQELGEWVIIKCPWSDTHSEGGDLTAGYSPMGWGGPAYLSHRIFHCFHDSCKGWRGGDLMDHIANANGPELPSTEYGGNLVRRYALSGLKDGVWDTMSKVPRLIPMNVFKNLHPETAFVHKAGATKPAVVAETTLFIRSKSRVTVTDAVYDPTTQDRLIRDGADILINQFVPPTWGDGDWKQHDVDMFQDYIRYLVPDEGAREFFLDWLSAKCQNMAFRGPAILMIATMQGTGRTTLGNMLTTMLGNANVVKKPFSDVAGTTDKFNSWMVKSLIITDETIALEDKASFYKAAERLKERIDTTPTPVTIRQMNTDGFTQMNYSSYLMFSNHAGAMRLGEDDRRFYVINNPEIPAEPDYFVKINQWIEDGTWAKSIWRWLRTRDVDVKKLLKPAEMTRAKEDMLEAVKQPLDVAIAAILEAWPCDLIASHQVSTILDSHNLAMRLGIHSESNIKQAIRTVFRQQVMHITYAKGETCRFSTPGMTGATLWVPRCKATPEVLARFINGTADIDDIHRERDRMPVDLSPYGDAVIEALNQYDF